MPKSFFDNPVKKNLTVAGVLRINIWPFIPVPKIKFDPDPPPHGKNALVLMSWPENQGILFFYISKTLQMNRISFMASLLNAVL